MWAAGLWIVAGISALAELVLQMYCKICYLSNLNGLHSSVEFSPANWRISMSLILPIGWQWMCRMDVWNGHADGIQDGFVAWKQAIKAYIVAVAAMVVSIFLFVNCFFWLVRDYHRERIQRICRECVLCSGSHDIFPHKRILNSTCVAEFWRHLWCFSATILWYT